MASLGEAFISVVADTSGFEESLETGLRAAVARTALGGVLGGVVAAGVAKAVKEFLPLERAILQIFQVQGVNASNEMFSALEQQIYDVSNEIAKPAEEVGSAIALGIGRGFSQTMAVELSGVAGDLANALGGDATLASSMKVLTASINGFNIPAEKATEVAGTLFQTISKSGAPVDQFAQQLGSLGPLATSAGLGLNETAAAIATMVQNGNSPAEAVTNIRTAITELSDAQTTGGKVFKEISGKTFPEYIKAGGSLQKAVNLINDASKKSGYSLSDLTSNYNTQNAIVGLAGQRTEQFTKNLADNKTGVDAMGKALESAEQGGLFRFNEATNRVQNGIKGFGGALRPLIDMVLDRAAPAVEWFADVLVKVSDQLRNMDWSQVEGKLDQVISRLKPFGDVFVNLWNVISALDWNEIFTIIAIRATPVIIAFGALSYAAELLAAGIEFATPFLRVLVDIFSYLAVGAVTVQVILKPLSALVVVIGVLKGAMFVLGPVIRLLIGLVAGLTRAIGILRIGMAALSVMTGIALGPLTVIVATIAALTVAFVYAWKNSEKFREIVVSVANNVKNAVVTYFEFMASAVLRFAQTWLTMAKTIVDVIAKVPVLGGVAKGVSSWLQQRISELSAVEAKVHQVAAAAKAMNWELNYSLKFSNGMNADKWWDGSKWVDKGPAAPPMPKIPKFDVPKVGGLGDLLDPNKSGSNSAADKAKQTAKTIRDALQGLYDSVRDFVKGIGEKSLDQIQSGFDSIIDKYRDAITTASDLGQKAVVTRLKKSLAQIKAYEKTVEKLAKKRDVLTDHIKAAEDALKAVTDFRANAAAAFADLGKVSEGSAGIGVTFLGIRNNLKDAIRTTQAFSKAFKELQRLNLNPTALRQIADAGPAALDQAMALARSGPAGIAEINKLFGELDKVVGANADNMTKEFFDLGVAQAEGILKGLQSQRAKLVKEMESLGAAMANGMKKTLGIKSPSKVFDEIGRQVPAGMTQGIRRGTPDVAAAIAAMASQRSTGVDVGGITISGVSDPAAARRAGILAGQAIQQTLESRKSAAVLAGVG